MVERAISRRDAVAAAAVAAAAAATTVTAGHATAATGTTEPTGTDASAETTGGTESTGTTEAAGNDGTVRGSWRITPQLPDGAPPFVALAAFGAGRVFITTGSDEPGTGIGQWESPGPGQFAFAYTNFHFNGSGALASTVDVVASGTFAGDELTGTATLRRADPNGDPIGEPQQSDFTGVRMSASP